MLLCYPRNTKDAHAYENMNITHSALQPKVDKVKTISDDLLPIATSMIDRVNNLDYK